VFWGCAQLVLVNLEFIISSRIDTFYSIILLLPCVHFAPYPSYIYCEVSNHYTAKWSVKDCFWRQKKLNILRHWGSFIMMKTPSLHMQTNNGRLVLYYKITHYLIVIPSDTLTPLEKMVKKTSFTINTYKHLKIHIYGHFPPYSYTMKHATSTYSTINNNRHI
jgi:hypothetical protein